MNGWIRIGAKLDSSKFDAQAKELMYKIEDLEKKAEPLKESIEEGRALIQTIQQEIDKASEGLLTSEQIIERINGLAENGFDFTYQFEDMRKELGDQEAYLQIIKAIQEAMVTNLQSENREYQRINNQIQIYKDRLNSTNETQRKMVHSGTNGFKSLTRGAKNLVLGIIGVASAYNFFRKASNAVLQNDEKLTKQIETNWVGLGTILEPAVRLIVDLFKKATTGILYFMKLLTGVDYIAKANAAALKKQAKATNELTKANEKFTASFDELNLVQENINSGTSIDTGLDESMLFNINDLSETTREAIEKVAKALEPVKKIIEKIIEWGKEHPDMIMAILGGAALLSLLSKIIGVSGVSGLLGVNSILLGLAALGVITIGICLYYIGKTYQEVSQEIDNLINKRHQHSEEVKKENEQMRENAKAYEINSEEIEDMTDEIDKGITKERDMANAALYNKYSLSALDKAVAKATGEWDLYNNQIVESTLNEWEYLQTQKDLYTQGKLNASQIEEYKFRLEKFNERLTGTDETSKQLKETFFESSETTKQYMQMIMSTGIEIDEFNGKMSVGTDVIKKQNDAVNNISQSISNLPERKNVRIDSNLDSVHKAVDNITSSLKNMTKGTYNVKVNYSVAHSVVSERDKAAKYIMEILGYPMATGGIHIVNNPGKGVLSGGALTGEVSHEGVIPLTNESAMEMLGESIGKHVTIYATLVNKMNGKTISRELQEVNSQSAFASNM